jgi:signal recognition particle GTPase
VKIRKWVESSQEVDVDVCLEDVQQMIYEADLSTRAVLEMLNRIGLCLKAVPGEIIREFNEAQRKVIRDFLAEQAKRYAEAK